MATYEYDCRECGRFEVKLPMGRATGTRNCPGCHRSAHRVFSAPHLSALPAPVRAARAREERSRDEPDVVTAVPPKPRRAAHPALSRLPRP
ncbi:FmdB family zinc ribbon protein [Saccharopolyspora rosea]|uniref:FmdB family zinc ribbon protein n=1 Tax=Saccharopolyspora rosea TaxID=524884 RepID=UPI0021D83F9C|nr:zinc ribbon domain-containing protein [Saccharopolyspora rosea]